MKIRSTKRRGVRLLTQEREERTRFRNQMSFYGSSGYMFFSSTRTTSRRSSSMDSWFHSSTGTDLYSIDSYRIERGSEPISPVDEGKSHGKEVSKSSFKVFGNEFNCWPKWRPKSCISIYAIFRSGFFGGFAWSKRKKPLRWLIEFPSRRRWRMILGEWNGPG